MIKRILIIIATALITFLLMRNCGVNETRIEQKELNVNQEVYAS